MAWYEFRSYERIAGAGLTRKATQVFEALDDDAARSEAGRRTNALPPGHFGQLLNAYGQQLDARDSPSAGGS
jgi:hypothetical protein